MGKFFLIQAFYCVVGVLSFVHDLFDKVLIDDGIIRAFIWPYALWPLIRDQSIHYLQPVLQMIPH